MITSLDTGGIHLKPDHTIEMSIIHFLPTNRDISLFIDHKLKDLAMTVANLEGIEEKVRQRLIDRADGTFLWIGLAFRELETSDIEAAEDIGELLEKLPSGLGPSYDRLLGKLAPKAKGILLQMLRCSA
jgi:hypothetical protein